MHVSALTSDPFNDMPIVVLRDADDSVTLPIRIGLGEACAIAAELDGKAVRCGPFAGFYAPAREH